MISVIIPTYNCGQFIPKLIPSIRKQQPEKFEIIVIDDGSTDETYRFFEDKPFHYTRLSEHRNANYARNKGLEMAKGEYVFFCDADAYLYPDCFSVLREALEANPDKSYAYCKMNVWPDVVKENTLYKRHRAPGDLTSKQIREKPCLSFMSLFKRQDLPDKLDEDILRLQDWDLYLTLLEQGKTGIYVDKFLFGVYLMNRKDSISGSMDISFPDALTAVKEKHKLEKRRWLTWLN